MDSYWHLYFFLAVIFPDCAVGIVHGVPAGNLANKIVGIMWQYHDGTRGGFCIGTPITKKRVVTTASCLSKAFKDKGPEVTDWRYGKKVQFKVYMDLFTKKFNGLWSEETAVDILKNPLPGERFPYHSPSHLLVPHYFYSEPNPAGISAYQEAIGKF